MGTIYIYTHIIYIVGEVSQLESDIRSRSSMAASASASGATDTVTGESLGRDIDNLPEILNKKANLEAHTNILQVCI